MVSDQGVVDGDVGSTVNGNHLVLEWIRVLPLGGQVVGLACQAEWNLSLEVISKRSEVYLARIYVEGTCEVSHNLRLVIARSSSSSQSLNNLALCEGARLSVRICYCEEGGEIWQFGPSP